MAPRYVTRSHRTVVQKQSPMAAMPGTLAEEAERSEPFGLSTLSSIPPSVLQRTGSKVVTGLTYSQVALRSPSPTSSIEVREELTSTPVEGSFVYKGNRFTKSDGAPETSEGLTNEAYHSQGESEGPEDGEYPWTQVSYRRRRSKSLPASEEGKTPFFQGKVPAVTPEQLTAYKQAEEGLTPSEKERIQRRMNLVREFRMADLAYGNKSQALEEGTSKDKGKTVDPRNWGAVNIPEFELDLEAQRKELEAYEAQQALIKEEGPDLSVEQQKMMLDFWNQHHQQTNDVSKGLRGSEDKITHLEEEEVSDAGAPEPGKEAPVKEEMLPSQKVVVTSPRGTISDQKAKKTAKRSRQKARKVVGGSSDSDSLSERFEPAKAIVDLALRVKEKPRKKEEPSKGKRKVHRHKSLAPSTQVEGGSYLGQVLTETQNRKDRKKKRKGKRKGSPSDFSSSSPSGSEDSSTEGSSGSSDDSPSSVSSDSDSRGDSDDSTSSSSESSSRNHRRHKRQRRKSRSRGRKGRHHGRHRSKSWPRLKPEKPEKYDGTPDAEKFHRFARQAQDFLKGYRVSRKEVASRLSNYLEGKAYSFYANTVSDEPEKWSLRDLLVGIFDYCFPLSFRNQQRMKLHNFRQRELTVRDYAHELQNLFRMVGMVSKQDRVDRLWYGLNLAIRNKLTEHELSPMTTSWNRILRKANFMETAIKSDEKVKEVHRQTSSSNQAGPSARAPNKRHKVPWDNSRQPRNEGSYGLNTKNHQSPKTGGFLPAGSFKPKAQGQRPQQAKGYFPGPQLSEKEREERKAAGLCFICGEGTHMARNCPRNSRVKSDNKGRPPGVSSFSMSLGRHRTEDLRAIAGSTKSTEAVQLACVELDWDNLPRESSLHERDLSEVSEEMNSSDSGLSVTPDLETVVLSDEGDDSDKEWFSSCSSQDVENDSDLFDLPELLEVPDSDTESEKEDLDSEEEYEYGGDEKDVLAERNPPELAEVPGTFEGDHSRNGHEWGSDFEGESALSWADEMELLEARRGQEGMGIEFHASQPVFHSLERTAAVPRDLKRLIPEPIVVVVDINGCPARTLMDTGSLTDFISTKFAQQIQAKVFALENALPVHLAVQGSRTKINYGCRAVIEYQEIKEDRHFDVCNLSNYDVVLGTPFLFQHQMSLGLNPTSVLVGSTPPLPIEGKRVRVLESLAAEIYGSRLEEARKELREYAAPICKEASDSPLPPLRKVNHVIPLIDEDKVYPWRPSKCPDAHRGSWAEKRDAYLKSGRWKMTTARNTSPMLLLTKPGTGKDGTPPRLRVVADLRERNKNTKKLTSPLPDMEGILRRLARKPYRSLMDGKDAYEQIRVDPAHVERTAMTTPDGNMVSLVMQQGDCNAVATYQSLMNYIFAPYIGVFLDVYLDDIVIYSDTLEDHIEHVKTAIDILRKEELYLSSSKLHFLGQEMKVLGRIIDDQGIRMDPEKVDSVLHWKVPTSKELLRGFLGSVGYLADDIATVRVSMGILTPLTGSTSSFRWDPIHQRAFNDIKRLVHAHREHRRKPLDYSKGAPRIWLVTDGSLAGASGVVSQGETWNGGRVAAFFSAKLSPAQMNYPVHEIEMLAGVESMKRHRDILLGCHFTWVTDHKGLLHLFDQRNLSGRQARWLEAISEFDFDMEYVPGVDNLLADALSRIYSNDATGTVRTPSEYVQYDDEDVVHTLLPNLGISMPIYTGLEAMAAQPGRWQKVDQCKQKRRPRKQPSSAETGRPETSKEFAKRIKRVILHTSAERQEGASGQSDPTEPLVLQTRTERVSQAVQIDEPREMPLPVASSEPEGLEAPLLGHIVSTSDGIDVVRTIRDRYKEDKFFQEVLSNTKHFKNFVEKEGLIFLKEKGLEALCIPDILARPQGRKIREIIITHAHSLLAHLGSYKTLRFLRDHVWWKSMSQDVQKYCDTCSTCRRSKPNNQKPYGLLNPLAVPTEPWETIGVDFVGPLPESEDRNGSYDSITVIIDLLTCMVHLVPSRTTHTAKHVAELLFSEVYKHHGLPKAIVSDRDVVFTSTFWAHLNKLIGVELRMSSAYHPESDGSTERANRTITQMVRNCIGPRQRDWVSKLPAVEFAINSARSESTGYAPFFLNHGRMPRSMIWDNPGTEEYPAVRAYAQKVKYAIMMAHDSILGARVKQTRDANRRRRPSPFVRGDLVYVSTKNLSLPKGLTRKFIPKFIGPYRISEDFGNNSYRLELSANLRRRGIHDVFHSSLLRAHEPNDDRLFPGRLDSQVTELEDREEEWAIDRIASHKGSSTNAIFECVWRSGDRTWVPYASLTHLEALKVYFEVLGVESISELDDGTGVPPEDDPQVYIACLMAPVYEQVARGFPTSSPDFPRLVEVLHRSSPSEPIRYTRIRTSRAMSLILDPATTRRIATGVVFQDPQLGRGVFLSYTQLRRIFFHDLHVRDGKVSPNMPIPAGYIQFSNIFNQTTLHTFRLCPFNVDTRSYSVVGKPIPSIEDVAPRSPEPRTAREIREEKAKNDSLLLLAEQTVRQAEFKRRKMEERLEEKRFREELDLPKNWQRKGKGKGKRGRREYQDADEEDEGADELLSQELEEELFGQGRTSLVQPTPSSSLASPPSSTITPAPTTTTTTLTDTDIEMTAPAGPVQVPPVSGPVTTPSAIAPTSTMVPPSTTTTTTTTTATPVVNNPQGITSYASTVAGSSKTSESGTRGISNLKFKKGTRTSNKGKGKEPAAVTKEGGTAPAGKAVGHDELIEYDDDI